jgi:signal transduction histidine kinase
MAEPSPPEGCTRLHLTLTSRTGGVPLRALTLTLLAATAAVSAAAYWPQALVDEGVIAGGLALAPALLLAHYRGWPHVKVVLGAGLILLILLHLSGVRPVSSLPGPWLVLFVLGPYIAMALGVGWFGEVRRYRVQLYATQLQLIQSEKMETLGRMAAGVAHEVKNPLMTLLTGVRILSKRLESADPQTRQVLQDMSEAVARADRIVGGLLSYSRNADLDLQPADLNAVVETSLLLVRHELEAAGIAVTTDLDRMLPTVRLDEFKIQQVLVNLFTNALHAIGRDGSIAVRTGAGTVALGDSRVGFGLGVPAEHLGKVFDPFFTTKPTGVGTGLGLAVSRQIVEMHGGTIEIANRPAGGARVTLTFKLAQERSTT